MNKCLFNTTHITSATTFTTALKESKRTTTLPPTGLAEGPLFPWICWTIWTTRNQLIFENRVFSPLETLTKAICLAREWQEAQVHGKVQDSTIPVLNRRSNATNTFAGVSVYTDASWKEGSNNAGLGWIFTDHLGSIIIKESKLEEFVSSPLMAEGLAIREALLQARRQGYSTLTVFSDAQTLLRAINDRLSMLNPARYIRAKVATSANGTVMLGMTVADRLRRNRKITMTTKTIVSISVN